MYRLNTVGQDKVAAALLLLACLGVGQSAFAAPAPTVNNAVADYTVNEDRAPRIIDLWNVFRNGDAPRTYSVASNSDPSVINAYVTGNRWLNIDYLPDANGVVTIRSQITDNRGRTATDRFVVTVRRINDAPVFVASPAPVLVAENSPPVVVDLTGMFSDVDLSHEGDTLTLSVSGNSDPTLFSSAPSIAGNLLTLRFAANKNGFSSLTIRVRDSGGLTATGPVDVTVTSVNNTPVVSLAIPDQYPPEDAPPIPIALHTYLTDPDTLSGDVLTYTVTANDNVALITTDVVGSILTLTLAPASSGIANLTVEAVDLDGARVEDSFFVNVGGLNDTPVAVDDAYVVDEDGGPIDLPVLANDTPGDAPTIVISAGRTWNILGFDYPDSTESTPTTVRNRTNDEVTLPNGTLLVSDSFVSYTPKADYNGTDSFYYTIRDSDGEISTALVTLTINPINDQPIEAGTLDYTIVQGNALDILAAGGIVNRSWDADTDTITVVQQTVPASIGGGFAGTTLGLQPDGAFLYVPDPAFVGTDTFDIKLFDGFTLSDVYTVTISVTPTPPPPPPPPPGTVSAGLGLAELPLEDAVSAEANVLVIMDDSGSMDWSIMTNESNGVFAIRNAGIKDAITTNSSNTFAYLMPLASNNSNTNNLPTEAGLNANATFVGNNYGVWRGRNSQYNTVYYNPKILYRPWVGLNRSLVDFPNSVPTAAPMDPYESPLRTINLTTPLTFTSNNVPRVHGAGSTANVTNTNVYLPHYYTTPAVGRPAWNDPNTLVEIRNDGSLYQGGPARTDCIADDADPMTCTYASEIQNFANWFTYYRSREYMAKGALGRTVSDVTNVRLAYVVLNDANQRTPMASMNASYRVGTKKAMMDQIYKVVSNNGTPLRAALDRAGKYFECKTGGSFGSPNTVPGDPRCPVFPSPQGQCQNNYSLLFSDGTWNEGFTIGNKDGGVSDSLFDGGKFADTIAHTLADVAMHYYERDLHPGLSNGVPTTTRDTAGAPVAAFGSGGELMHQHMKTFTIALGLEGTISPASVPPNYAVPFAWGDPFVNGLAKIDDMLHAAVNGRGQFLQANDPVLLSQALQSAFQEFSAGSVSVSAVAFNSTALREQTVEYRGFFNLKYNSGDLRALEVDATTGIVNEAAPIWRVAPVLDTQSADSRVIITYDRPNDVGIAFRHPSLNTDQLATLSLNEVNYLRGDRSLEEPLGTFRARPQFEGMLGDIVHSAPQFVGGPRAIRRDQPPFPSTSLYSAFKDAKASREPLVYVAANDGMLHGFNASNGRERVGYVPNQLIDSTAMFKNRLDQLALLTYSHKFFVDVTPTVEDVFAPPYKGSIIKDWTTMLVGGLGAGGKGYYALNVSNPGSDYTSEATAKDAVLWEFTDQDDTYPVDNLGTPLGGAVGALVDTFGSPIKDLGYSYSQAQIVMTNVNDGGSPAQKKWAAIFGNGYNSSAGIAKLFVLPVEDGLNGWQPGDFMKLDTGFGPTVAPDPDAGLPNGLGTPTLIDYDRNGTADIAYAGDRQGNLFRFNVSNSNPAVWSVTKLFQATYTNGTTLNQPITTQPYVFKHPTLPGFIVIVGTGSYITELDGVSTEIQSVYGIWDRGEIAPATANSDAKATRLVQQTVTNIVDGTADGFQKLRYVSANPVDYVPDAGVVPGVYGWYFDFTMQRPLLTLQGDTNDDSAGRAPPDVQFPGERAIRRFVSRGDSVLVTTVIPRDSNSCLRSPPGSTFPIDALTGGNPTRPILDLNNDGIIDDGDFINIGGVDYAAGILFSTDDLNGQLVDPSLLLGSGDADFLFLSGGDEQITIRVAGPEDSKTGRLSWRELENAN